MAGHKLGIGQRENTYDMNLYSPSVCDKFTLILSKFKNEASSNTDPIFFSENSSLKN